MVAARYPQRRMLFLVFAISSLWYSMTSINLPLQDINSLYQGAAITPSLYSLSNFESDVNEFLSEVMLWPGFGPEATARRASAQSPDTTLHHHHDFGIGTARDAPRSEQQEQQTYTQRRPRNDLNATTLALLYPSGLIGGYRNQALRFIAFCKHAMDHNITQLLLPSLLWSTRYHNQFPIFFWPVPFQELFDVDHWNSYHYNFRSQHDQKTTTLMTTNFPSTVRLPLLVDSIQNSDCWRDTPLTTKEANRMRQRLYDDDDIDYTVVTTNQSTTSIRNGAWFIPKLTEKVVTSDAVRLQPTANATIDFLTGRLGTAIRKIDFRHQVQQCRHPQVYGGGMGAGILWNDYLNMPKLEPHHNRHNADPLTLRNTNLIASIYRALIPAPRWRHLATQCLQHHLNWVNNSSRNSSSSPQMVNGFVALHARVETEMMVHRCGRDMEKNLTTLLDMVDKFIDKYNNNKALSPPNRQQQQHLHGIMIAVGREGMQEKHYRQVAELAEYNWKVLNARSISYVNGSYTLQRNVGSNTTSSSTNKIRTKRKHSNKNAEQNTVPVFECGEGWVTEAFYNDPHNNRDGLPHNYYGSILPSIVNFWLAVEAEVFVGVMKSSWSTDVWTTRYYQGKGHNNFQYTVENGIIPVPNRGLPPPHKNC